jgi:nitrogen fixation negative regulator NifL
MTAKSKLPPDLFYQAVEQNYTAMFISDLTDNILYANPAFKRISQSTSAFLETLKKSLGEKWQVLRANQGQFIDQEILFYPGGYHPPRNFLCSGQWLGEGDTGDNKYFLLLAKEITQLKRQQEEMHNNALRALLAEEELTEGMRETLAGAIHQLQVPINLISATLAMLKRRANQNQAPLAAALDETLNSVNQAIEHLYQCMPSSENHLDSVAPVNLNELIRDVLTISTKRLLTEGIMVDWKPALILPSVLGHIGRLRGMFKQLIDNSIESVKNKSGVRELRILTSRDDEMINVIIEDTGSGIPEKLHFKIFEPFFSTKKGDKHAGMGLATVQDVVNQHAGTIRIDPNYTAGSRFILQFPIKKH